MKGQKNQIIRVILLVFNIKGLLYQKFQYLSSLKDAVCVLPSLLFVLTLTSLLILQIST